MSTAMFKTPAIFLAATLAAVGCASDPTPLDNSAIGITRVDVRDTGASLQITALDANSAEVATLHLDIGPFMMEEYGRQVVGRRLSINVLGQDVKHESEGFAVLNLPLFSQPRQTVINEFLLDARVQPLLAERGITFKPAPILGNLLTLAPPRGETRYDSCTYALGSQCTGSTSCAEGTDPGYFDSESCGSFYYPGEVQQAVCCGDQKQAVMRACDGAHAQTSCGGAGPNGCKVCWQGSYNTSCTTSTSFWPGACTERGQPTGYYAYFWPASVSSY